MSDWKRIKAEYIAGGTSYRKLAEKYKVSLTTLTRTAKREDWRGLRKQTEDKVTSKIVDVVSEKNAKIDDTYYRLVDKLLKKAEKTIDDIDEWHPTLLKEMATTMKYLKECKGIKSDADAREQEARIEKLRKDAEREDDSTKEIEIVFNAGPGEWNE